MKSSSISLSAFILFSLSAFNLSSNICLCNLISSVASFDVFENPVDFIWPDKKTPSAARSGGR